MNNTKTVPVTVADAAGKVLDYIMDDPTIQQHMHTWIQSMYPDLNQSEAVHESNENTTEEALYYAATTEFHSRVLNYAALGLLND